MYSTLNKNLYYSLLVSGIHNISKIMYNVSIKSLKTENV
jgi:hypothetical protein